jgi:hypothetical protein
MRPITVTVGPLATASANNISTLQTPAAAGCLLINGTTATYGFAGTAAISGNVLTVSAVTSGVLSPGMAISGAAITSGTTVIGFGTGTGGVGTYILNTAQTFSSGTIYGNAVATLDTPRRVLITSTGNESAKTFTIVGIGVNGNSPQSEVITGPNIGTAQSVLDYKTVTSIVISAAAANTITVGTSGVAGSNWVAFDAFAPSMTSIQCNVTGTIDYTVQTTLNNPCDPSDPITPVNVAWVNSSDSVVVNATANQQSNFMFAPVYARILINSGAGSVAATFLQSSNGPI